MIISTMHVIKEVHMYEIVRRNTYIVTKNGFLELYGLEEKKTKYEVAKFGSMW